MDRGLMITLVLLSLCISFCLGLFQIQECSKEEFHCVNGGICERKDVGEMSYALCMCFTNTSGHDCGMPNFECIHDLCQHDTQCGTDGRCNCTDDYSGEDCGNELCLNEQGEKSDDHYCRNGGICTASGCVCPSSTVGSHCEYITCGDERRCLRGYCYFSQCECAIKCPYGCNTEIGMCYSAEPIDSQRLRLSPTFKYLLAVGTLLVLLISVAFIYAAVKMARERRERRERVKENAALTRASEAKYNKWLDDEFEKHANAVQQKKRIFTANPPNPEFKVQGNEQVIRGSPLPEHIEEDTRQFKNNIGQVSGRPEAANDPEPTEADVHIQRSKLLQVMGSIVDNTVGKVKTKRRRKGKKKGQEEGEQ